MGATSSQTEEECGQDTNHSAMTLPVERQPSTEELQDQVFTNTIDAAEDTESEARRNSQAIHLEVKKRIYWPPASQKEV